MIFLCVYQKIRPQYTRWNKACVIKHNLKNISRNYKPVGTFNLLDLDLNVFLSVYDMIQIFDF